MATTGLCDSPNSTSMGINFNSFREVKVIKVAPQIALTINSTQRLEGSNQNSVYDIQKVGDKLYIADYRNNKIIEFNPKLRTQQIFQNDVFQPHGLYVSKDKLFVATHKRGQRIEAYSKTKARSVPAQGAGMSAVSIDSAWERIFFVDDGTNPGLYELLEEQKKYKKIRQPCIGELRPHCVRFHGDWDQLIVANRGYPALFIYGPNLKDPQIHHLPGMDPLCAAPVGNYLFVVSYADNRIHIFDRQFVVKLAIELTGIKSKITNLASDLHTLYVSEEGGNRIFAVAREMIFDQLDQKANMK